MSADGSLGEDGRNSNSLLIGTACPSRKASPFFPRYGANRKADFNPTHNLRLEVFSAQQCLVSDGSTLNAPNSNLTITGSPGQGVVVVNDSHATLAGATVTGSGHGGLVVDNLSSIDVTNGNGTVNNPTMIGGNAVDLFCDASSMLTGSANLAGVPISQCANVLGQEASLP